MSTKGSSGPATSGSATTLDPEDRPLIDNVALVANAKRVQERRARFEEMWASAVPR